MPEPLDLDELGDEVRGPVEEGAGEHGSLHALALRVGLVVECATRVVQARTGDVEAVLHVVEQPARQRFDEPLLRRQRVGGDVVGTHPVAVVVDAQSTIDHALRAVRNLRTHGGPSGETRRFYDDLRPMRRFFARNPGDIDPITSANMRRRPSRELLGGLAAHGASHDRRPPEEQARGPERLAARSPKVEAIDVPDDLAIAKLEGGVDAVQHVAPRLAERVPRVPVRAPLPIVGTHVAKLELEVFAPRA